MTINIMDHITDEKLEKLGYTKETFKGSNLEAFMEAMFLGIEKTIEEETKNLMREHSLTYAEARIIAVERTLNSFKKMINGDYDYD